MVHYYLPYPLITEVFGSNGSVGDGHFVLDSQKFVTLGSLNTKSQFGECENFRNSQKSVISQSFLHQMSVLSTYKFSMITEIFRSTAIFGSNGHFPYPQIEI